MSFARHEEIQSMPNLLEIQKNSYKWFLEAVSYTHLDVYKRQAPNRCVSFAVSVEGRRLQTLRRFFVWIESGNAFYGFVSSL